MFSLPGFHPSGNPPLYCKECVEDKTKSFQNTTVSNQGYNRGTPPVTPAGFLDAERRSDLLIRQNYTLQEQESYKTSCHSEALKNITAMI